MLHEKVKILRDWIKESDNIVFFGGAGVSTESGIPDFRSIDGIYHMQYKYPPETILSHRFFTNNTEEFYRFYKDKMIFKQAQPNVTHLKLSELEAEGKLKGIITQNIDGLHQKAGSQNVFELHGSILRNYCMKCNAYYCEEYVIEEEGIPICNCGGIIKPDVVLYEEMLNEKIMKDAVRMIAEAELLIAGGTSLSVYPAASLVQYYRGDKLVLVNKSVTSYDREADLLISNGLGQVFSML